MENTFDKARTTLAQKPAQPSAGRGTVAPKAQTIQPVLGEVNKDSLASEQLNKITSQDSPLMQRANQEGIFSAQKRGLSNSSLAAGASMGAMVDRATPLAQQDANAYQTQNLKNQESENSALAFNASEENKFGLNHQGFDHQTRLNNQNLRNELELQDVRNEQSTKLAEIEADYKLLAQNSASAAQIVSSYQDQAGAILSNNELDGDQINKAMEQLKLVRDASIKVVSGVTNTDLSEYAFQPAAPVQEPSQELQPTIPDGIRTPTRIRFPGAQ